MSKRGRVLRDPSPNGPGLLVVEGQQYSFSLDGTWRSLMLPKPGLDVDVEFNQDGAVASLVEVPESQLAREHADRTLSVAQEKGAALVTLMVAKFGRATLIATGVLVLGWFFLNALTYDAGIVGKLDFTFWRVLGLVNSANSLESLVTMRDGGSAGVYGLLAWLALAGPFVGAVWKDKRAILGGLLPLGFMVLIAALARSSLLSSTRGMPSELVDAADAEIRNGISLGVGAYISFLAALYLGFMSVKTFLTARNEGS